MQTKYLKILGTVAAGGFISALVCGILYLMELPIFDAVDLAWTFVYGLGLAGVAVFAMIAASIWDG